MGTTAKVSLPYPEPADLVTNGPAAIKALAEALEGDDVWHTVGAAGEPAFQNGWGTPSASTVPVKFRKDGLGNVTISGNTSGGASGSVIFTLPLGYRPAHLFTAMVTTNGSAGSFGQLQANPDGTVTATLKAGNPSIYGTFATFSAVL